MPKRKRTATVMDKAVESTGAGASASVVTSQDAAGTDDEASRAVLQPRPNPPGKRARPSGQLDKERLCSGSRRARGFPRLKPQATAAPISLPPEIWRAIGQTISHPKTLKSLVSVSRAFRNIFTPILHARRIINLEYFPDSKPLREVALPPYLEYVQDFRINVYEFRQAGATYSLKKNDDYAAWITRALESTRCLRSFSWRDESFEEDDGLPLILRNPNFLRVLKSNKTLKRLCFQFGAIFVHNSDLARNCYFPLTGFRNMTSLELYDFYRDRNIFAKELATFLCDSPSLKKLGIGFATERTHDDDEAVLIGGPGRETDFFERLCKAYGSACRTGPLALDTLRLGAGVFLSGPSNPMIDHHITQLLTVRSLKVLHLYNGLVISDLEEDSYYQPIDWTPFPSTECKSLHQLSVCRLGEDVTDWLRQDGNCVQELIVTDHYRYNETDLNQFFRLPALQLSMIWTREKYPWRAGSYDDSDIDSDWTDTDSSLDEWSDLDSSTSEQATLGSMDSLHSDWNAPQSHTPTLTAPNIDRRIMTVLDRLPDGGSHLNRLCLALDFERQWSHFSSHLKDLTRLTQLRLNAKSWRGGEYPTLASSIWADTTEDTPNAELARRFAHLISTMCPTLRYIMIGHVAWEIIRPSSDHAGIRTRSKSSISLRELDMDELLNIELFEMTDFAEQGGLPGRERDREEKRVGRVHSTREINAMLVAQGFPPLPV